MRRRVYEEKSLDIIAFQKTTNTTVSFKLRIVVYTLQPYTFYAAANNNA